MNNPAVFIKEPLIFNNKFKVYPPSIKEVVSNPHFSQFLKVLTITQEDIQDQLKERVEQGKSFPTPFEFLLINSYHNVEFKQIAIQAFEFFIHQPVNFFYEQKILVVGNLEETITKINKIEDLVVINEEEYFDFQNMIREVCGEKHCKPPEPIDPNENPYITAIKAKARERDKRKEKHSASGGISLQTCLVAICCMGIGITPLNIGEMSYAAIGPIMKMSQEKEKYDIDIRSLLAGADSKKIKPKYWIRNSEKE